jgi:hypothetical protein
MVDATLILRKILDMAGGPDQQGYVLAHEIDGVSVPAQIDAGRATYAVVRPETELGLRRSIVRSQGAPFIALVPGDLAERLPADVVRRARGGRVFPLDLGTMLALFLGIPIAATDDEDLLQLAFQHLEDLQGWLAHNTRPTVIERRLLDEMLLDVCVGERIRRMSPGEILADWLRRRPAFPAPVQKLVRLMLPTLHATEGRILAWALADPARLDALVVHGALLAIEGAHGERVWGLLRAAVDDKELAVTEGVFRATLLGMVREALDQLQDEAGPLLTRAENIARGVFHTSVLAQSTLLPLGFANRCTTLAQAAARGEAIPSNEIAWLRSHRAASSHAKEIAVVENLARLSRWLEAPLALAKEVPSAIERYQREGAFADVAAAVLSRALAATADLHGEAGVVLGRYRKRRDEENRAFAELLAAGYVKALHAEGVTTLPKVWKDVVLADPAARERKMGQGGLFLAVLDGCSYPVFLEVLTDLRLVSPSLGLAASGFAPARGLPALSLLPTITGHARSALFLGEIPNDPWMPELVAREAESSTDPARFARNAVLAGRSRRLFLKGELGDGGAALRQAIQGPTDLVAAVFNAVDDQIGSANTGARLRVRPEDIGGFLPALKSALEAGRRILITSDHGHTPFWSKDDRVGVSTPARWCELPGASSPPEGFIEIALDGLGGSPGRKAFAWKTGVYQGTPQVGFHGGCSLEEMVVPLAWLVPDGVPAFEPAWWYAGAAARAPEPRAAVPAPAVVMPAAPARPPPVQHDLFSEVGLLAARIAEVALPETVLAQLDSAERAALVLVAQNQAVRSSVLAARLGKPGPRVPGFMTALHRKLHGAGAARFRQQGLDSGEVQYLYVPPESA